MFLAMEADISGQLEALRYRVWLGPYPIDSARENDEECTTFLRERRVLWVRLRMGKVIESNDRAVVIR